MRTSRLLLSGLVLFSSGPLLAQNNSDRPSQRETVILSRDNSGTTTIELKPDGLYLDGEQIVTRSELGNRNLTKKIIIEPRSVRGRERSYDEYYNSRGSGSSSDRRAVLGVVSDSRRRGDGAFIDGVTPNSAADAAGLREGDIITRIDKRDILNAEDLTTALRSLQPGDRVAIEYNRNGKDRQTTATLGEARQGWSRAYEYAERGRNDEEMAVPVPPPASRAPAETDRPRLGVAVEDVEGGVRIRSVRAGSAAELAGLREDDVITYIDGRQIDNVSELQTTISNLNSGAQIRMEIIRNGRRLLRTVTWPKSSGNNDFE